MPDRHPAQAGQLIRAGLSRHPPDAARRRCRASPAWSRRLLSAPACRRSWSSTRPRPWWRRATSTCSPRSGQHNTRKSTTFLELADMLRAMYGIPMEPQPPHLHPRAAPRDIRPLGRRTAVEAAFAAPRLRERCIRRRSPWRARSGCSPRASHVAGPLGAGMANIGWAPPGCDVLLIDPGIGDFYYWDLAACCSSGSTGCSPARCAAIRPNWARGRSPSTPTCLAPPCAWSIPSRACTAAGSTRRWTFPKRYG